MALENIHIVSPSEGRAPMVEHFGQRVHVFKFPCENRTFCTPYSVDFLPGIYRIECWGASGGDGTFPGGRGSYVSGEISFSQKQTLYFFLGGSGDNKVNGTYNGGGTWMVENGLSGGGATDIRLSSDEDFEGLKARIMVSAGGGGAAHHGSKINFPAGPGGATTGSIGGITNNTNCITTSPFPRSQLPANQTNGGQSHMPFPFSIDGSFGKGGSNFVGNRGGTGGGGYFGGSSGGQVNCLISMGGGGSSYISGHKGCDSISENSTNENIFHLHKYNHYSGFSFTSTKMLQGNESSPSPLSLSLNAEKVGNTGNGCVRITVILSSFMIKSCKHSFLMSFFYPFIVPLIHSF